jgi:hypothetical protein
VIQKVYKIIDHLRVTIQQLLPIFV